MPKSESLDERVLKEIQKIYGYNDADLRDGIVEHSIEIMKKQLITEIKGKVEEIHGWITKEDILKLLKDLGE